MKTIINVVVLSCMTFFSVAQTISSVPTGGHWSAPSTWVGGIIPNALNSTKININGTVYVAPEDNISSLPLVVASLNIPATATLNIQSVPFVVNGSLTISTSGTMMASVGADATFSGNISAAGTLTLLGSTTFNGTTFITGDGLKTFADVFITGTLTPNGVCNVNGNFSVGESGVLNQGANTVIFTGSDSKFSVADRGDATFNNVTIHGGSSLTTKSFLNINGIFLVTGAYKCESGMYVENSMTVSVDSGSVAVANKPFTVKGILTVSSGAIFTADENADALLMANVSLSGTMTLAGTTTFAGITTITGNGLKTFYDVVVSGTLTPNATHTITGNLTLTGGGTLKEGSSTTTFAGLNSIFTNNGGAAVFNNVTIAAASALTSQSNLTCNGNFRATGSYQCNANLVVTGSVSIGRDGIFSSVPGSSAEIGRNLTISGIFTALGTTLFSGNTKITGAGVKNFNHVSITGTLTSYNGSISITGNFINDGTFDPNNGTVIFSGDISKTITSSISNIPATNFYSITVAGGDLRCETDVNVSGVLLLTNSAKPVTFDVDGASDNRTFTLLSTNDNPATDGSIGTIPDNAIISGRITAQRYMSGEGRLYRYLCSPMEGNYATVADWQKSFPVTGAFLDPSNPGMVCGKMVKSLSPSLFSYDEPSKSYRPFPSSGQAKDNFLTSGKGYAAFIRACSGSLIVSTSGPLTKNVNLGNVVIPVTHTVPVTNYNNLIGNPFPSAIAWDKITTTNISPTIAIRDNASGVFKYYTKGGNGATDIANGVVTQGQAFWVRSIGINPTITVSENVKVSSPASNDNIYYRNTIPNVLKITLTGSTQTVGDNTWIVIDPASSDGEALDTLDAPKMNNQLDDPYTELFDLYTSLRPKGISLAVNSIPFVSCRTIIHVAIKDILPGSYNFSFSKSGQWDSLRTIVTDRFAHKTFMLSDVNDYSFDVTADTASKSSNRFSLTFKPTAINQDVVVETADRVCFGDPLPIIVTESQLGINYSVTYNDQIQRDTLAGNGGIIRWTIPAKGLQVGSNNIKIKAGSACEPSQSVFSKNVIRLRSALAISYSDSVCRKGSVVLKASGAEGTEKYHWYNSLTDSLILSSEEKFPTPVLHENRNYYIAVTDSAGYCDGPRVAVTAAVIRFDDAVISEVGGVLTSNFKTGNQWYLNSLLLPDTSYNLYPVASGLYHLRVSVENCMTETDRELAITGLTAVTREFNAYPNPVTGQLTIEVPDGRLKDHNLLITDMLGRVVGSPGVSDMTTTFDFSVLAKGIYYVLMRSGHKLSSVTIIHN